MSSFGNKTTLYVATVSSGTLGGRLGLFTGGVNPNGRAKLPLYCKVTPELPVGKALQLYIMVEPFGRFSQKLNLFMAGPTGGKLPLYTIGNNSAGQKLSLYCLSKDPFGARLKLFVGANPTPGKKLMLFTAGF